MYFIKSKSEVSEKFKEFEARVFKDCGQQIGTLWSDNRGEYLSKEFRCYLKTKGIRHELTVPYSPEQNGVAERMNRTLMEAARSMMTDYRTNSGLRLWTQQHTSGIVLRQRPLGGTEHHMRSGMEKGLILDT